MTEAELDELIDDALALGEPPSARNDDARMCVDNDGNVRIVPFRSPLNGLDNAYRWTPTADTERTES